MHALYFIWNLNIISSYLFKKFNFYLIKGSINKEECSIKCKDGEEMGQNEQCQPCSKGTFREGLMSVCQRCQVNN